MYGPLVPLSAFNMFITHTTKRFKSEYQPTVFSYITRIFHIGCPFHAPCQLHNYIESLMLDPWNITQHSTSCMSGGCTLKVICHVLYSSVDFLQMPGNAMADVISA
jgi:hypothetical protein